MPNSIFNSEPEIAVLSILLNNPQKTVDLKFLRPFMLGSISNELILTTIQELMNQGSIPDAPLVANFLESNGKLQDAGGQAYIEYLKTQSYPDSNLNEFEKMVVDNFKAKRLVEVGSTLVSLSSGIGNLDEIIEQSRSAIENLSLTSSGEYTSPLKDVLKIGWNELIRKIDNPDAIGIPTCVPDLDLTLGGRTPGNLWIEAGRPSMGKTAAACFSILESGKLGYKSLLFSYEMSRIMLSERFLGIQSGVPISDIHLGYVSKESVPKIEEAIKTIQSLPIYIDTNYTGGLSYVVSTIRKYVKVYGIQQVFIDYIQLMAERTLNATNELGQISREMKLLANDLGISITILSQLNRLVELRDDKRPILSDLRQSGNLEEDADVVIFYYRDEYYDNNSPQKGILEHIVKKNRQTGFLGTVMSSFDTTTGWIGKRKDG